MSGEKPNMRDPRVIIGAVVVISASVLLAWAVISVDDWKQVLGWVIQGSLGGVAK